MTPFIDGPALKGVGDLLGLAGSAVSDVTEVDTRNLAQVLPVNEYIRRGQTPVASTGMFRCVMENVHGAADSEASTVDPYTTEHVFHGYPSPVPSTLDFWVLRLHVMRASGAGDLTMANLRTGPTNSNFMQGWGVDDGGAAVSSTDGFLLWAGAAFNSTGGGNIPALAEIGTGKLTGDIGHRVRRGSQLIFSSLSDGIVTARMILLCGLFPAGLGQDILV